MSLSLDNADIQTMKSCIKRDLEFIHKGPSSTAKTSPANISFLTSLEDDKYRISFVLDGKQEVLSEKSKFARPATKTMEQAWFELYKVVAGKAGWIDKEFWKTDVIEEGGVVRQVWVADVIDIKEEEEEERKKKLEEVAKREKRKKKLPTKIRV
ncbi:hypothetical protein EG328_002802 [Venturia inaequalis]|uniref:Uncharacterized protein n=1 Tax=Venturia inaequalis TaxID=5025 RepID=A0A8H3Z1Y0_VENIN|nr:hypothetical protein EG327_007632 [Venturia inaequalis]KAE9987446.1 hypothetical protein EG328_002802 [Venturia inaequalis]RDI86995.1 hypothetical protein Vi05172_g3199 [Venturia inaequalis]